MRRFLLAFAGLAVVLLALPIVGLLQRMPWSSLPDLLGDDVTLDALRVSLVVSLVAALVVLVLGTPLAWALGRTDLPGRRIVRALVVLPMVLPPVVGGAALLFALGRRRLFGRGLDPLVGLTRPCTAPGASPGATLGAVPLYVWLLFTPGAADERSSGEIGGWRVI